MKKNNLSMMILASLFVSGIMVACKKEKDNTNHSPAYYIAQSEKLTIPAEVDVPSNRPYGNSRVATYYAIGVQKYRAQAKTNSPGVYEWVFIAPKADLFNSSNVHVGVHGAGPYWALTPFDSIFAQAYTPAKTATPDPNSVPWLLLMPKTGKDPIGLFHYVSYIQRIATVGGKAPAAAPQSATDSIDVPYTAIYRFTKKN